MAYAVAVGMLVAYSVLGTYVMYQLGVLLAQKHNPLSYKSMFNWFALVWMILRATYWGLTATNVDVVDWVVYLLFWTPHCILYTTFATLALFLAKVIKRRSWTGKYRNRFLLLYGFFGAWDIIGTITLSILAGTTGDDKYGNIEACGNAVLFMFLCAAFVTLGWRLRKLNAWEYSRMFVFKPRTLSAVAFTLAAVFLSRCVFNFVSFAGAVTIDVTSDDYRDDIATVAAYLWWEFFPLILLLSTIAAAPRGTKTQDLPKEILSFGVFGAIAHMDENEDATMLEDTDTGAITVAVETSSMLGHSVNNALDAPSPHHSAPSSAVKHQKTASRTVGGGLGVSGGLIGLHPGEGPSSFGLVGFSSGLGRPGGFAPSAQRSLLHTDDDGSDNSDSGAPDDFSHTRHAAQPQPSGSLPPRPGIAAGGFLSAQHNAIRRTMYMAPQLVGPGSAASPTYGGVSAVMLAAPSQAPTAPSSLHGPSLFTTASYAYPSGPAGPLAGSVSRSIGTPTGGGLAAYRPSPYQ